MTENLASPSVGSDDAPPGGLKSDLGALALRGGAATGAAEVARIAMIAGSIVILARLLTPEDFGLIAMVTPVVALVTIADLGLPAATVQRTELSREQVSSLFWINVASGVVFFVLAFAAAPAIARFYGDPRLTAITRVIATVFLASGLAVQHEALLRRRMRFTALAAIEICSVVAGLGSAIVLALQGLGYWALVVHPMVAAGFKCAAVWIVSGWRPGLTLDISPIRGMLVYGRQLTAFRLIQYAGRVLDKVLIGYFSGLTQLGFYANASALVIRPVNRFRIPIAKVAHATLSRVQTDPNRYRSLYRGGVLITTAITLPMLGYLFVDSEVAILALLGPQWSDALPIFRVLIVGAIPGALGASVPWVYLSLGTTDRQFRWGVIESITRAASFTIGIVWGAIGVAAAYSISSWLLFIPGIIYCFRDSPLKTRDLLSSTWRSILACVPAAIGLFASRAYFPVDGSAVVRLVLDLPIFAAIYLLAWLAIPNGRKMAMEAFRLAR